jgi:hypothetical protein
MSKRVRGIFSVFPVLPIAKFPPRGTVIPSSSALATGLGKRAKFLNLQQGIAKMMRTIHWLVACVAVLIATSEPLQAAVITNGGFETGDLTGWSASGADLADVVTLIPHSGSYHFLGYDNIGFATLSQSFSTLSGSTYDLDFWSHVSSSSSANILRYQLDAGPIVTVPLTLSYALTTDSFIANGPTTTLSFFFETDFGTGAWRIDDVSVTQTSINAVPEPTSLAMFGIVAGAAGIAARRRRRRNS